MNLEDGLELLASISPSPCLLCGKRSRYAGIFIPGNSDLYGARPGKQRMVRYDVCGRCLRREDLTDLAEGIILGRLREAS